MKKNMTSGIPAIRSFHDGPRKEIKNVWHHSRRQTRRLGHMLGPLLTIITVVVALALILLLFSGSFNCRIKDGFSQVRDGDQLLLGGRDSSTTSSPSPHSEFVDGTRRRHDASASAPAPLLMEDNLLMRKTEVEDRTTREPQAFDTSMHSVDVVSEPAPFAGQHGGGGGGGSVVDSSPSEAGESVGPLPPPEHGSLSSHTLPRPRIAPGEMDQDDGGGDPAPMDFSSLSYGKVDPEEGAARGPHLKKTQ
jgi:hypothetical protein